MRLLITNDDGFDAPGLAQLIEVAAEFGEVFVAAPARAWSGCGHRICTDRPIEVTEPQPRRFVVDAFPADCVRLALAHLVGPVDWVLAGINDGGNLGADVHVSGTVAAAREASLFRVPSVALSQYRAHQGRTAWSDSGILVRRVLEQLLRQPLPGSLWNVNLPDVRARFAHDQWHEQIEIENCEIDSHPLPFEYEREGELYRYSGSYHDRPRQERSDVAWCFDGRITISRLPVCGSNASHAGEGF